MDQKPGFLGNLSDEQQKLLTKIKEKLKDSLTSHYTDQVIVKFLRARNFQEQQALDMLQEDIKWRKEYDVDNILTTFPKRQNAKLCLDYWPNLFHGFDKEGYPVFYERIGLVDPKGWCETISKEDSISFHIYCMEKAQQLMQEAVQKNGIPIDYSGVYVEDLQGLGWSHMYKDGISLIKEILSIDNNHYPEQMKRMFILHPPKIFSLFWKMFKPFIDKATLDKIQVVDSDNPLTELTKYIDIDQIPQCFGGEAPVDVSGGGPFNSSGEGLKTIISPGQKFEKEILITKKETTIGWEFKPEGHTIGFACYFLDAGGKRTEIVKYDKYDGSEKTQGQLEPTNTGKYILSWDNSFSKLRKKTLIYQIHVSHSQSFSSELEN